MQRSRNDKIIFPETVTGELLPELNSLDAITLIKLFNEFMDKDDLKQADLYAKKMALDYGVAGIICYYNVHIKHLQKLCESGEKINRLAFNMLPYLFLGERLWLMTSSADKQKINELFPGYDIQQKNYWRSLITRVCEIGDIQKERMLEAKQIGLRMLPSSSGDSEDRRPPVK